MDNNHNNRNDGKRSEGPPRFNFIWIYILIGVGILGIQLTQGFKSPTKVGWSQLERWAFAGHIERIESNMDALVSIYIYKDSLRSPEHQNLRITPADTIKQTPLYVVAIPHEAAEKRVNDLNVKLREAKRPEVRLDYRQPSGWASALPYLAPIILFIVIWVLIIRRMGGVGGGPGSQIFNIGKSKATLFDNNTKVNITFTDVAGLDEAKEEVMEIVDFLKNPRKYTTLGGKIPKGVLLVGPPGTGKTLLAKAVAGEAGVPFFSISGSDFVEMFVGVGASRVRDLFRQAREKAPVSSLSTK